MQGPRRREWSGPETRNHETINHKFMKPIMMILVILLVNTNANEEIIIIIVVVVVIIIIIIIMTTTTKIITIISLKRRAARFCRCVSSFYLGGNWGGQWNRGTIVAGILGTRHPCNGLAEVPSRLSACATSSLKMLPPSSYPRMERS